MHKNEQPHKDCQFWATSNVRGDSSGSPGRIGILCLSQSPPSGPLCPPDCPPHDTAGWHPTQETSFSSKNTKSTPLSSVILPCFTRFVTRLLKHAPHSCTGGCSRLDVGHWILTSLNTADSRLDAFLHIPLQSAGLSL